MVNTIFRVFVQHVKLQLLFRKPLPKHWPSKNSSSKVPKLSYVLPWIESVFAKVNFGDFNTYVIGSIYRPPTSVILLLIDSMSAKIDFIAMKFHNMKCILTRDMNIDLFKVFENQSVLEIYMVMNSNGFLLYIVRPIKYHLIRQLY